MPVLLLRIMHSGRVSRVDMVPGDPGIWMYHCHVDDHMDAGMVALHEVEP
jgi:FtsP/CotA-like multicopper oxidase with cupredoxin domain